MAIAYTLLCNSTCYGVSSTHCSLRNQENYLRSHVLHQKWSKWPKILLYVFSIPSNCIPACICLDTDWFPGWSRKYGREPSSRTPTEDCVELRQSFPGLVNVEPNDIVSDDVLPTKVVKNQLYWNDQECRQENWFVCSKRITNPTTRKEKQKQ